MAMVNIWLAFDGALIGVVSAETIWNYRRRARIIKTMMKRRAKVMHIRLPLLEYQDNEDDNDGEQRDGLEANSLGTKEAGN